ncbi:hypothetical protein ACFX1W_030502 [Malus domestica]
MKSKRGNMLCSVTVANSSMLSPPSSLFCNKSSMISLAPETLHLPPLPSGLASCSSPRSPVTQLKRKRPVKLCIPVVSLGFRTAPPTLSTVGRREMMVKDREGYYHVCCKRGRREALEDHYSASLNLETVIWRDDRNASSSASSSSHGIDQRNWSDVNGLLLGPDLTITDPYLKGTAEMYQDGLLVTVDLKFIMDAHISSFEDVSSYGRNICFDRV